MWNRRLTPRADRLWALLVYNEDEPVRAVEQIILGQAISTRRVRKCSEAAAMLRNARAPALVVTDTSLPDGDWADVLKATRTCASSPPLIVVSRLVDIRLYLDVMESGAYDFVVPPLLAADVAYVVDGALLKRSYHGRFKPQKGPAPSPVGPLGTFAGADR